MSGSKTNVFLLYIMVGVNVGFPWGEPSWTGGVINCWSDGMYVSKRMCIATELFREYTTPVIIMDNVGHMERCTIQHENARKTSGDLRAIRAHQVGHCGGGQ